MGITNDELCMWNKKQMSEEPSLKELIEFEELQSIQDSFARTVGISSVIFSTEGEQLTQFSNSTSFCSLIQSTKEGKRRCFQSFMEMSRKAMELKEPKILYCFAHGGHFVAPIIIHGKYKGTMFAGQFISQKFSVEQLKELEKIAVQINVDPQLLVDEAKKMRIVEEDVVRKYSGLLFQIEGVITKLGTQAAELNRAKDALQKAHDELEVRVKERTAEIEVRAKELEESHLATLNIAQDLEIARKEAERVREELKVKNTELERFTYTVSHDLKSPLITLQGFVKLLRDDLALNEKKKVESDLKFIESSATKMDRLLTYTLSLSRIGHVANQPEDVPFGEIVQEVRAQTIAQIKSGGVEVSMAEDFPTVHVDRMKIEEVLVNLIENSIKYMGEQPHPKIDIGYHVNGKETVFSVKDNGIGIDRSQHEKVFELFYKLDKNAKGTGAGLAIVARIIKVHGGRIWVESEMGEGCTVCFTLPVS